MWTQHPVFIRAQGEGLGCVDTAPSGHQASFQQGSSVFEAHLFHFWVDPGKCNYSPIPVTLLSTHVLVMSHDGREFRAHWVSPPAAEVAQKDWISPCRRRMLTDSQWARCTTGPGAQLKRMTGSDCFCLTRLFLSTPDLSSRTTFSSASFVELCTLRSMDSGDKQL